VRAAQKKARYMANKIPMSIKLPPDLKKSAAKLAKREHRSLSNLIETLLAKACSETKESE
jgi:predicted transcriptional regulator